MVNTQTFLTGLFYRFRVKDKEIQAQFTQLYSSIITTMLKAPSEELRIALFRKFFAHIRVSLDHLTALKTCNGAISDETLQVMTSLAEFTQKMIAEVISMSPDSHQSFRQIINHAFVDEIVCDIGQLSLDFKSTKSLRKKVQTLVQLKIVLNDYNISQGTTLSVRNVLYPPVKTEL